MNIQNLATALVTLLVSLQGLAFGQTAAQISAILRKNGGQQVTTDIRIEAGNAYNEEFSTTGLPNIPSTWGPLSTAVVVNAVNGGAGRGRTGLNNKTGYNIQGTFYVISHAQNPGEFVSVHVAKVASNINYTSASVAAAYYAQLANVGGLMKFQIKYPTMSGEITDTCPTTVQLSTPYDFLIEYNIIGNYLRLSFNNQICTNFTLDANSAKSIGTLVLGSSGGSTGRNVAYLIDNLVETPIPHAGVTPTVSITSPANGATDVEVTAPIVCTGATANSFEVALGTTNPPTNYVTLPMGVNNYNPEPMVANTPYFVRCRGTNENGVGAASAVVSFTTRPTPSTGPHTTPLKLTAARLTKLAQMRTDYLADTTCASYSNQQRMACDNWRQLLRVAAQQDGEWEFGHMSAMLSRVSGEDAASRCNDAWLRAKSTYTAGAPFKVDSLTNPNTRREFMMDQVEIYDWCYPQWTQARRDEYLARLNEIVKKDYDTYIASFECNDVDQPINLYFTLAALKYSTGSYNPIAETMWADAHVGGLTATSLTCLPVTAAGHTLRNVVAYYYATMSTGGAWAEGTDYGIGTPFLGIWGCESIRPLAGSNPCTEIDTWMPEFSRWWVATITRDAKHFVQVGDTRDARTTLCCFFHSGGINNLHVLTGLLPDGPDRQNLMRLILNLRTQYGTAFTPAGGSTFGVDPYRSSRSLALADLYATATADFSGLSKCYQASATGAATGYGVNIFNNGSGSTASQFWIQFWPDGRYIDHGHDSFGNFQWYRRGEWPATNPTSYAGNSLVPEGNNAISIEGLGAFPTRRPNGAGDQYKRVTGSTCGSDYMAVSGTMGGLLHTARQQDNTDIYYDPPPRAVHEYTRSAFVKVPASGTYEWALIEDRINAENPESLEKFVSYGSNTCYLVSCFSNLAYWGAEQQRIQAYPRWTDFQHHWTDPTVAGASTTWTLSDGQVVSRTWLAPDSITTTKVAISTIPQFNCSLTFVRAPSECPPASEQKYRTTTVSSVADVQFNYLSRVFVVKNSSAVTSPTITELTPTNNCAGVLVSHPSDNDTVVISNAAQGTGFAATVLYPTAAQAQAVLATARYRTAGACSTTYVQTTASATVVFKDLNPTLSWSYTLDGGGSVPLTEDSSGVAQITVPTATTHTIVLTGV